MFGTKVADRKRNTFSVTPTAFKIIKQKVQMNQNSYTMHTYPACLKYFLLVLRASKHLCTMQSHVCKAGGHCFQGSRFYNIAT
jgi:hypothetical protein